MASVDRISLFFFVVLCSLSISIDRSTGQLTSATPCPLDIAFVVDHSGSISDNDEGPLPNWAYVVDLMVYVVQSLFSSAQPLGGVRFAAVSFGSQASIEFNLNDYSTANDTVRAVVAILNSGGNTNTTGALRLTRSGVFSSTGNRPGAPDVVLLITDGVPSRRYEADNLTYEAELLKSSGVRIVGVGVTTAVNVTLMRQVVSDPSTDYFGVMSFVNLTSILQNVTTCIASTTSVTAASPSTPTTGSTTSTTPSTPSTPTTTSTPTTGSTTSTPTPSTSTTPATPTSRSSISSTTSGSTTTFVPPILPGCSAAFDLIILLDASGGGSNTLQQFDAVKQYVINLIGAMDIASDKARVGLIVFADRSTGVFNLAQYVQNVGGMVSAIRQLSFIGGGTNTASALQLATINLLQGTAPGRRVGTAQPIIMLITYGPSNNYALTQNFGYAARVSGIEIFALTIGTDTSYYPEINTLVSSPSDVTHQYVTSVSSLTDSLRNRTIVLLCNNEVECASFPCINGGTCSDGYGTFRCACPAPWVDQRCDKTCLQPSDVVFVMDVSGSIGSFVSNYGFFLRSVIGKLSSLSRTGILTFADNATIVLPLIEVSFLSRITDSLTLWQSGGTTNTAQGIATARDVMLLPNKRPGVDQFMVVVTDGMSSNNAATKQQAAITRDRGIVIVAIGETVDTVNYPVNVVELQEIASSPLSATVILSTSDSLIIDADSQNQMLRIVCSNVARGCDSAPCLFGGTCSNEPAGGFTCSCASGYTGAQCERTCSGVIDLVFVIDDTGYFSYYNFGSVLQFIVSIVDQLEVSSDKTRIAAIKSSNQISVEFTLGNFSTRRDVVVAVQGIAFTGGRTNISGMLGVLRTMLTPQQGGRTNAKKMMVMITDGENIVNSLNTLSSIAQLHIDGVTTIVIGVGLQVDLVEASLLASYPISRNFFDAPTIDRLSNVVSDVVSATCDSVDFCQPSPGPCQNGGTCLSRLGYYRCTCPLDFSGQNCTRRCSRTLDVAFVLDLSNGVDDSSAILDMTNTIIQGLPISASQVHVSLMTYSDSPTIMFYLNNYTTVEQVLFQTAVIYPTPRGLTNTDEALGALATDVFGPSNGVRSGVSRVAIILTSGQSENPTGSINAANVLRQAGVEIYVIAYETPEPFMGEVNGIASRPTNTHVQVYSGPGASITTITETILAAICGS